MRFLSSPLDASWQRHVLLGSSASASSALAALSVGQAVGSSVVNFDAVTRGRVGALSYAAYALWWASFPAEGLTRRRWRPYRMPDLPAVRTLGTSLLRTLRIARHEPEGEELLLATTVSTVAGRAEPNGTLDAPLPMSLLSISIDERFESDPPLLPFEAMELMDLMDMEGMQATTSANTSTPKRCAVESEIESLCALRVPFVDAASSHTAL